MKLAQISIIGMAVLCLSSCLNVATTGAQAVYNRHSIETNINDQLTTYHVYQAINHKPEFFKDTNVAITTYNNEVLLAGQVPFAWQREKLKEVIKTIPDIDHVYNLVEVSNPTSTLTRISDAWLTAKVKAKLIASADVDATHVKVMTENGTVYLMGILRPDEAQAAVEVARNTDGVQDVVKVFSYIIISHKSSLPLQG